MINLNFDEIRTRYHYDPDTGFVTYKVASAMMKVGDRAGCVDVSGFRNRRITYKKKCHLEHRFIWFWVTGEWPSKLIDHINGNPLDNRWVNLRLATHSQNSLNKKTTGKLGAKGVCLNKGKYKVTLCVGSYDTLEEAKAAYREAALRVQGEFMHHSVKL